MNQTEATLARAVKFLDAVEVEPGLYAWRGCEFECYVTATAETLSTTDKWEYWAAGIDDTDPVVCMPEWWSPKEPFAIKGLAFDPNEGFPKDGIYEVSREQYFASKSDAQLFLETDPEAACLFDCTVITVNPQTGEELPA